MGDADLFDSFAEAGAGRGELLAVDHDGCLVAGDVHADLMPFTRSCVVIVADDFGFLLFPTYNSSPF